MRTNKRFLSIILSLVIALTAMSGATFAWAGIAETLDGIHNTLDFSRTDCTNAKAKLSKTTYAYNGKIKAPSVTVTLGDRELKKGTDYKVIYNGARKNVGTYKVTVEFIGNCEGADKELTFKVNPAKTSVKKLKAKSKAFKVEYKKVAKQADGYEITYADNKAFNGAKTATVKKAKTVSKTVKGLKSGKTYYVKVRTYKSVNGKKFYSGYTKAKTVKVK